MMTDFLLQKEGATKSSDVALRPSYWACVSGGKDSLFMLNLILHNTEKYPLDGVIHYELEIDFPFIKDVIAYMEWECKRYGIRFVRIKPRKTWRELYENRLFPTRKVRWCQSEYKLDAQRQLEEFLNSQGLYCVKYIGYCLDEEKRWAKRSDNGTEVYPLVQEGVCESTILEWAKHQPIFNHYYEINRRCGCMLCPMADRMSMAYMLKYYPEWYELLISLIRETEQIRSAELGKPFTVIDKDPRYNADYLDNCIRTKWLDKLNQAEKEFNENG